MATTGLVYDEKCLLHDTGPYHPESPARLEAIRDAFAAAKLDPPRIEAAPATEKDLLWCHVPAHIALLRQCCNKGMPYPDADTVMGAGSWDAAMLAVGGAINACRAVLEKKVDNAFWAMRPPGHHAEADRAMGFCLFNNIAIAARWLREEAGLARVAILDWDIHHGNGTQHIFYDDATVFYASLHQHPHYPGTGYPDERGKDNTNLNIQMPPGCAPEQWIAALDSDVIPAIEAFDPEFLLLSSGFDAHRLDPLGRQLLEVDHFVEMTRKVKHIAKGRIVSLIEGGYHLEALAACSVAHFKALQEDA